MTVKEGERDDVPIEENMKISNPQLNSNQTSTSDKSNQMGIGFAEMWSGVGNMADTIIKLQEAMFKENANKKKAQLIEVPQDVHVNSQ